MTDRLEAGVCARLSRYLVVLAQAKRMGKERITSRELGRYTNINATQIRRDLSRFGSFGTRGVGYPIDVLLAEIRTILGLEGKHRIALIGAGRLGRAITSSTVLTGHGFEIAAVFDADVSKVGLPIGRTTAIDSAQMQDAIREQNIVIAVLAVTADAAQEVADDLVTAGVSIILNYSEALLRVPQNVTVRTANPAGELLTAVSRHLARP